MNKITKSIFAVLLMFIVNIKAPITKRDMQNGQHGYRGYWNIPNINMPREEQQIVAIDTEPIATVPVLNFFNTPQALPEAVETRVQAVARLQRELNALNEQPGLIDQVD
jgi:hypothetical protein